MRVQFIERQNGPERMVCEAEIVFDDGPLQDMKLVGFALWRGADGEKYVTFPSRAIGAGTERRFFDYLRSANGNVEDMRRVKAWILESWQAHVERQPQPTT